MLIITMVLNASGFEAVPNLNLIRPKYLDMYCVHVLTNMHVFYLMIFVMKRPLILILLSDESFIDFNNF